MAVTSDKTLTITLHRRGSPDEKKGTFTGPPPKMRIPPGVGVSFNLKVTPNDNTATYTVTFPATPFTVDDTVNGTPLFTITDATPHKAVFAGLFHYRISVNTSDGPFEINNCPELDVDPGLI